MKRLLSLLLISILPLQASASETLTEDWGSRAGSLYDLTTRMILQIDHGISPAVEDTYLLELDRFSLNAERLSDQIRTQSAKAGFACLYHDLSIESRRQLMVLRNTRSEPTKREALRRLALLLMDADTVAQAALSNIVLPMEKLALRHAPCQAENLVHDAAFR